MGRTAETSGQSSPADLTPLYAQAVGAGSHRPSRRRLGVLRCAWPALQPETQLDAAIVATGWRKGES